MPVQRTCEHCAAPFMGSGQQRHCSFSCRFWSKADKSGPPHPQLGTPCWLWTAGRSAGGYGHFARHMTGLPAFAHRISWEITHGPTDLHVLHRCHTPACINPTHLYAGTQSENLKESGRAGRWPGKKLCADSVRNILAGLAAGKKGVDLAEEHRVSPRMITSIKQRKAWAHVDVSSSSGEHMGFIGADI